MHRAVFWLLCAVWDSWDCLMFRRCRPLQMQLACRSLESATSCWLRMKLHSAFRVEISVRGGRNGCHSRCGCGFRASRKSCVGFNPMLHDIHFRENSGWCQRGSIGVISGENAVHSKWDGRTGYNRSRRSDIGAFCSEKNNHKKTTLMLRDNEKNVSKETYTKTKNLDEFYNVICSHNCNTEPCAEIRWPCFGNHCRKKIISLLKIINIGHQPEECCMCCLCWMYICLHWREGEKNAMIASCMNHGENRNSRA